MERQKFLKRIFIILGITFVLIMIIFFYKEYKIHTAKRYVELKKLWKEDMENGTVPKNGKWDGSNFQVFKIYDYLNNIKNLEIRTVPFSIFRNRPIFHVLFSNVKFSFFFRLAPIPPTPLLPSLSSPSISSIVIYFISSVIATFSATINGSNISINILAGDEAKFAPAIIIASK